MGGNVLPVVVGGGSVKVFESDLLENVQVVATKAGHLSEYNLN